ncbi:hypothetical protein G7054_g4064 [Neopestalotiopsis clavispora]|nr:hypothetical protein G7054_g4064 [Neopestalotiopsis clavispora]
MLYKHILFVLVSAAQWIGLALAESRFVFAHFMVGNTGQYGTADWETDISAAKAAKIDAFALNMAQGDSVNGPALEQAFQVAKAQGFKLFFSFDYAGNGPWAMADVIDLLATYGSHAAYFQFQGGPLASTFEGPNQADDWKSIKAQTGCFFLPDYSSLGAKVALEQTSDVVDGLFNWAAWPVGPMDTNLYVDASYQLFLNQSDKAYYMASISPWFYTNMPGYDKNWLWRGDDLWHDRWNQIINMDEPPQFIEIISWNDYGESHYIGPLNDKAYVAFDTGEAPINYVKDMPHDGWRSLLPYYIDMYKSGTATMSHETLSFWYRLGGASACGYNGDTVGNAASHLQIEYDPTDIVQDKIFFSVLLSSEADISVTVGGAALAAQWTSKPYNGGVGVYHGNADFSGKTGDVTITVSRQGQTVVSGSGRAIGDGCVDGVENFNAYVQAFSGASVSASPKDNISDLKCVEGFGLAGFEDMCEYTCSRNYCPIGTCTCTKKGPIVKRPVDAVAQVGYPANGDPNWGGLCSFACDWGYCPRDKCSATEQPVVIPKVSPFTPDACTSGWDLTSNSGDLCEFTCAIGYCPYNLCSCGSSGDLAELPAQTNITNADSSDPTMDMRLLCRFSCKFGYCPEDICIDPALQENEDGDDGGVITVDDPNEYYNYTDARWQNSQKCILYNPPDSDQSNLDCKEQCQDILDEAEAEGRTSNYGCIGFYPLDEGIPWEKDAGVPYEVAPGKCFCDNVILNELADTFLEALPIIAEIGCFVLMSSLKLVFELAEDVLPEGKALTAGVEMLLDAAKLSAYVYSADQDPAGAFDYWLSPCGNTDLVPDDIKSVFDLLSSAADGVGNWKKPSGISKGSGKKGDDGNPSDRAPQITKTATAPRCKTTAWHRTGAVSNTLRSVGCLRDKKTTTDRIVTTAVYAATPTPVVVDKTCLAKWGQACYHYSSAVRVNPQWATLTCPPEAATTSNRRDAQATATWSSQHRGAGWQDDGKNLGCQRDEYPPAYLLGPDDVAFEQSGLDSSGQLVRWLPDTENRLAGGMWKGACFGPALAGMSNADFLNGFKAGPKAAPKYVNAKVKQTWGSITVTKRPEFTIGKYEHAISPLKNDGLEDNPCWPKNKAAQDPGFALLTYDPYYQGKAPPYDYTKAYVQGSNGS